MENLLLGNVIESGNISPFSCPFCGYNGSLDLMGADRFPVLRTLQVIGAGRRAARCPKCKSSDKERLFERSRKNRKSKRSKYIAHSS